MDLEESTSSQTQLGEEREQETQEEKQEMASPWNTAENFENSDPFPMSESQNQNSPLADEQLSHHSTKDTPTKESNFFNEDKEHGKFSSQSGDHSPESETAGQVMHYSDDHFNASEPESERKDELQKEEHDLAAQHSPEQTKYEQNQFPEQETENVEWNYQENLHDQPSEHKSLNTSENEQISSSEPGKQGTEHEKPEEPAENPVDQSQQPSVQQLVQAFQSSAENEGPQFIPPPTESSTTKSPKTHSLGNQKSERAKADSSGCFDLLVYLSPYVVDLIYWRDQRKSGIVFGAVLAILISLSVVSFISVISYASLAVLTITVSFRLYKNVLQAVQKTQLGHPFKEFLDMDVTVPAEKVHEAADLTAAHLNGTLIELRRLFLVEDLVDSVKFGLVLWLLTYIGSWFNGLTLVILGVVGLFTLPKIYETHQDKIDQNLNFIRGKFNEIIEKIQAVVPIGKKPKSQ